MHIAISEAIPPHKPMSCFFESFSLKIKTDITELKTIALPLTSGKNSWLGSSPDNFKFKKFIVYVHIPHIIAKIICFYVNLSSEKLFLERIVLYAIEHIKATNKNPFTSGLCTDVWCIFCNTPILP